MDKKDIELGMFVSVIQNTSSLSKNRAKVKRLGKVVGIYSNYANLLLFESDLSILYGPEHGPENIKIKRKLYNESFRFSEISKIDGDVPYERWKSYVPLSVNWEINVLRNFIAIYINAISIGRNLFYKKYKCYNCKYRKEVE